MSSVAAIILFILYFVSFFSSQFSTWSPIYSFSDELLVLFSLGFTIVGNRFKKDHIGILFVLFLFWFYVFLISVLSPYYRGAELTMMDILLFSKPIILFVGMMNLPSAIIKKLTRLILLLSYLYLLSAFLFYFVNQAVNIFPAFDSRFGINSYSFIANNPGEFGNLIFVAGIIAYSLGSHSWARFYSVLVMIFLSLLSLRIKAIALVAVYVLLISARSIGLIERKNITPKFGELKTVSRVKMAYLIIILPLGLALGANQFSNYFLGEVTPRLFIAQNAITVAANFFPFGAGGGTFGSAVSKMYYSGLYLDLGFSGKWGLTETDTRFLSDNFWPMVVAQYGVIGFAVSLLLYTKIAATILRNWVADYRFSIGIIAILINLVISTLGSAILIGNLGMILIVALVIILRRNETKDV